VPIDRIDTGYGPDPISLANEYGLTIGTNWKGIPSVSESDAAVIVREGKRRGVEHQIKQERYDALVAEAKTKEGRKRAERAQIAEAFRKQEDARFVAASQADLHHADSRALEHVGTESRGAPGLPAGVPLFRDFDPKVIVELPEPDLPATPEYYEDEGDILR